MNIKNKNVDIQVIDKVVDYVKAALNPKVPEGKTDKTSIKSKKYDTEYNQ